ncbi:MAG TPA: protease pro-enzyme activation domain-containing protein [Acidobacteriaceae bacterium]|nr:protease pro-enzyme activation domain-containing protein [Acidobacteriaceae bacterium]
MFRTLVGSLSALAVSSIALLGFAPALAAQSLPSSETVVPSRIVQPVDNSARITLHGYVHPLANAANDRGPAPDSMPLTRMHLVLQRSAAQEAALRQFIAQAHTPGSPNYHKWLTPQEFGQQFGPSDQDVATVESWLAAKGFAVTGALPGKQIIEFSGNVAQMRDAFGVQVHHYEVNGNPHFATATEPQIPAALAPVVAGFVSLNNFRPKSYARVLGKALLDLKTGKTTPEWTVPGGEGYPTVGGVNFALSPADFAVQYDLPNATLNSHYVGTTYDGTGQTLAIINESNINITLVNQFRTLFGLPANPPNVIIDGNDPGIDGINDPDGPNDASPEAYLDVEWSGAVAPKATVDLVIAADTALESGLVLAAEHAIYGNVAPVMSMSFGACEADLGSGNAFIDQSLMEQAAAQGITVMVSTGDSGSAGCDDPDTQYYAVDGLGVNGFASTPWDVAVGGTDFYYGSGYASLTLASLGAYWNTTGTNTPPAGGSLLAPIAEQPWNNSQFGLDASNYYTTYGVTSIGAGSGGASSAAVCSSSYNVSSGACNGTTTGYPKPAWQTGSGVPADGVRDIPDVSLFAADGPDYSYYAMCYADGDCQPASSGPVQVTGVGGTSAAAPAFAGIMALVNEKYGRQGQADVVLYPLKTQYPAAFHDITVGTNAVPCASGGTNCIAVSNEITVTDPTYGAAAEGEIGTGTTPDYKAAAGYNRATGLGSVDAAVLLADWGNVENSLGTATVTLTPSPTTFTHGTGISISGSVTGSGTPSGFVALMTSSTVPLTAGVADYPLSSGSFSATDVNYLPGGTYQIWGQYSGDHANGPSQSIPVTINVTPGPSTTALTLLNSGGTTAVTSGSTSVPYGTQIEVNAYVYGGSTSTQCATSSSSSATHLAFTCPTGAITFSDSGNTINTAILNAEGDAEYNAPFAVGSHSVTASYAGDNSYTASTASPVTFTIVQNTPTVFIGASNYVSTSGSSGAFTLAGGQDSYFNILIENSANLSSSGSTTTGYPMPVPVAAPTGSVTVTGLPGGTQTITLAAGVDPSTGQAVGLAVVKIAASASASSALDRRQQPNPWIPGGGAAVFACVVLLAIPARRRGWRNFVCVLIFAGLVGAGISCGGGGSAGNVGPIGGGGGGSTGSGSYTVGITYSGDGNYVALTGSNAQSGTITITAPTLLTTTISANISGSISPTTTMTVSGTVTGQSGHPAPTGIVYVIPSGIGATTGFYLNPGSGDSSSFTGSLTSQTLFQGANFVTLQYGGDTNYNGAATILNNGNSIGNPLSDFSITAVPSFSFAPGTGSTTLFVNPANGFSGTVSLTCSAPTGLTCSLGASSVTLPASGSNRSSQVTLSVTGATAGSYPITITGIGPSGKNIHTFDVTAVVQ